jgi:methyl-accepting chemotaxis protein
MVNTSKRTLLGRGKGYLTAGGTQSRFIIFLIFVLVAYTLLLRVFQKLAEILQLPVFLPISLATLLIFIGIVGTVYSHAFVGPMARIRRAIDNLAAGDISISLRLRESDDPMLKELVQSITRLCEHSRNASALIRSSAQDLFTEIIALQEAVRKGADRAEIGKLLEQVLRKQDVLEKAIHAMSRS